MPKVVDHDARRREVLEAVWRLAARGGLETVSVRSVATEAGLSAPTVQRYFPEKEAMLTAALTALEEDSHRRGRERIARVVARHPDAEHDPRDLRAVLAALFDEFLPLDEHRRTVILVHIAYFARAVADRDSVPGYSDDVPVLVDYFAQVLRAAQRRGTVAPEVDARIEADILVSLAVACGNDMAAGTRTRDRARRLLDHQLGRLIRTG